MIYPFRHLRLLEGNGDMYVQKLSICSSSDACFGWDNYVSLSLQERCVENSEHLSALLRKRKVPHNVLNARPKYAAREAEVVAQAGRNHAITLSTNMAGRGTDIILGGNPKMLAKGILEDAMLSSLTPDVPDVEIDSAMSSDKVLSKVKVGPSSLGLLAKTAVMSKYVSKSESKKWTYDEARNLISESIEMSQSMDLADLQKLVDEETETYPLGPSIALAYLSVLKDCESHCYQEVKRLGGLHVIGTSCMNRGGSIISSVAE